MSNRNKTRAEKRAAGMAELSVWISVESRQRIQQAAEDQGVSLPLLVEIWAAGFAAESSAKTGSKKKSTDRTQ